MNLLRYSLLRIMLLFACLLTLYLLGARGVLLIALTAVSSIALSYFLLKGPREQMAQEVAERVGRRLPDPERGNAFDEDANVEDREDDARRDP